MFKVSGILSQKGVTFIELLVVMAIVLTLGTLSATFYSRFLLQTSVDHTVDQIVGSLRKAQFNSMMSKQGDSWSVNYSSSTITLYKGSVFASRNQAFDEEFSVGSNITISGLSNISFARMTGVPTSSLSIAVSAGGNSKNITMNTQGMVTR